MSFVNKLRNDGNDKAQTEKNDQSTKQQSTALKSSCKL